MYLQSLGLLAEMIQFTGISTGIEMIYYRWVQNSFFDDRVHVQMLEAGEFVTSVTTHSGS